MVIGFNKLGNKNARQPKVSGDDRHEHLKKGDTQKLEKAMNPH